MTSLRTLLIGGFATATQVSQAATEMRLPLKDLYKIGINPILIHEAYREQAKIELNWNEVMKVSADEEGEYINVNTLNGIAVIVPIYSLSGPENKIDIPGPK